MLFLELDSRVSVPFITKLHLTPSLAKLKYIYSCGRVCARTYTNTKKCMYKSQIMHFSCAELGFSESPISWPRSEAAYQLYIRHNEIIVLYCGRIGMCNTNGWWKICHCWKNIPGHLWILNYFSLDQKAWTLKKTLQKNLPLLKTLFLSFFKAVKSAEGLNRSQTKCQMLLCVNTISLFESIIFKDSKIVLCLMWLRVLWELNPDW